jgi:hypothetical protein
VRTAACNRVGLFDLNHIVINLARLGLLHFLDHALTTVRVATAVTEELVELAVLPADSVLLRNLVNRNF